MPDDGGNPHAKRDAGILQELAGAEIKLTALLLDFPNYRRRFVHMLRSPIGFFHGLSPADRDSSKHGVAFMLQGITLAFVLFTMGWALPQSIANFAATRVVLISGSRADLSTYVRRVQQITRALPPDVAKDWRAQGELMLLVRALPEDRFKRLLTRLAELARQNPELLKDAISGALTHENRFGGRNYVVTFFSALDPQTGPLLHQTHQVVAAGPRYKLQPHMEFFLRTMLLWYVTCYVIARLLPTLRDSGKKTIVFGLGAYLTGFLTPLVESFHALVHVYLAATLPTYIRQASSILTGTAGPTLALASGGIFPYENLMLGLIRATAVCVFAGVAAAALAVGIQRACQVSRSRSWAVAGAGLGFGLGMTEGMVGLAVLILAPTGLL